MNMPTQAQFNTALRYGGTAIGGVATMFTFIGVLPADTAHQIVDAFQKLMTDLQLVVGDLYVLAALIFPVVVGILAKLGWNSASNKNQIASVKAMSPETLVAAVQAVSPKTLIASVQEMPAAQVTVTDPKLAEGISGVKVTNGAKP